MRNKEITRDFYANRLSFSLVGEYDEYLIFEKDGLEIHFFLFEALNPRQNDGQIYLRTTDAAAWYNLAREQQLVIPTLGHLEDKPWGQREFSVLDPDHNLLTFGEEVGSEQ